MAVVQYNFKIEEALKEQIEKKLVESGAENKAEFLKEVMSSYIPTNSNIDLSRYDNTNKATKEAITKSFKHILSKIDSYSSDIRQEAKYIEEKKIELLEKEESYTLNIDKLNEEHKAEIEKINDNTKELLSGANKKEEELLEQFKSLQEENKKIKKDLSNAQIIAQQVETIIKENTTLRSNIKDIEEKNNTNKETLINEIKALKGEIKDLNNILQKEAKSKEENEKIIYKKDIDISNLKGKLDTEKQTTKEIKEELKKAIKDTEKHTKETSIIQKDIIEKDSEIKHQDKIIQALERDTKQTISNNIKEVKSLKIELNKANKDLNIALGKLEILQEHKEPTKDTKAKEEPNLFDE